MPIKCEFSAEADKAVVRITNPETGLQDYFDLMVHDDGSFYQVQLRKLERGEMRNLTASGEMVSRIGKV